MSDEMSLPNAGYRPNRPGQYRRASSRMDPNTRRLMLFAGGLAGVLVCLITTSMLLGHRNGAVPVVLADLRPIKVKPDNPGGMQIDGAENDVFSGGADNSHAKLAPAAETPNPNGVPTVASAPPPRHSAALQGPNQPATQPTVIVPPLPVRPAMVVSAALPKPAAPAKAAVASVSPSSTTTGSMLGATASGRVMAGRSAMVQLAALTTEQAAHDEWQMLAKRMPDLLNGRQPSFSHIERDGHTFWRLRTAGFSDAAQAKSFCEQVRAKGSVCSVADF